MLKITRPCFMGWIRRRRRLPEASPAQWGMSYSLWPRGKKFAKVIITKLLDDWLLSSSSWRCGWDFECFNLQPQFKVGILTISCGKVFRWMPQDHIDDKFTLVQVMGWCHQTTSHYLNQCWPSYMTPFDVSRQQCVEHCWYKKIPTPWWYAWIYDK